MPQCCDRKNTKAKAIVRAALSLFSRKGYPLTSIEQISEEAGIGKSTVYEYFATKESLFEAAIVEAAEEWIFGMEAVGRETDDALTRLQRIADMFLDYHDPACNQQQGLFIEVLSQTLRQGGVFTERPHLIRRIYRRVVRVVVGFLLEGISRGQLSPEIARDAETIAIQFLAGLDGIQLHGMIAPDQAVPREQVAYFMSHQIPALLRLTPADRTSAAAAGENLPRDGGAVQAQTFNDEPSIGR